MDARSEGKLLLAWCAGEPRALEELIDRHQSALLRYAVALLGNGGGAGDAVQDAFLRLAQKPPVMDPTAAGDPSAERAVIAAWLFTTTKRLCMDAIRSESRRNYREQAVAPSEATDGGIDQVEGKDTRAAVERSLERLPADQREALTLRLFGELSYQDIAGVMEKKIGTVGWLISVGMKALQEELRPLLGASGMEQGIAQQGGQS